MKRSMKSSVQYLGISETMNTAYNGTEKELIVNGEEFYWKRAIGVVRIQKSKVQWI